MTRAATVACAAFCLAPYDARMAPASGRAETDACRLDVQPFRGVRYEPGRVPQLRSVTAPPYDVIGAADAVALERADPHNIVRAILPRDDDRHPDRYAAGAATWSTWLGDGTLTTDPAPRLYVYEQAGASTLVGVVAAIGLHGRGCGAGCRAILPHEEVMSGPVADRLNVLRATQANLEPILLAYAGGGPTAGLIAEVLLERPLVTATVGRTEHRLWAIDDAERVSQVAADLAPRTALIADGHHRYASYRAYQDEQHVAGRGAGEWDFGLALLVDVAVRPVELRSIDRLITGLRVDDAVAALPDGFRVTERTTWPATPSNPVHDPAPGSLVLTDGVAVASVSLGTGTRASARDGDALPAEQSSGRRDFADAVAAAFDAAVLHDELLPAWGVDEDRVAYLHDRRALLREVGAGGGLAVLLAPVGIDEVFAIARGGGLMPRKTTSFGPKPRSGLVMRRLD